MRPHEEHRERAKRELKVAVITVSTSRYRSIEEGDLVENPSAIEVRHALLGEGHRVVHDRILPDDPVMIRHEITKILVDRVADAIIVSGGTGLTSSDRTPEAIRPLFDRELPGFGELLRMLSYDEVGASAMLSRATAGIVSGIPVFCLPGSPYAVKLGMKLIARELAHITYMLRG